MCARQVSLLSFYQEKPRALSELIIACQQWLAAGLGARFRPTDVRQVHATLIGLERASTTASTHRNMLAYRGRTDSMDLAGMLRFIRTSRAFPFQVQVGGFPDRDHPFTSRGERPFARSFSIQGDNAVLIGWPVRGNPPERAARDAQGRLCGALYYPNTLHEIRQALQGYNILHAYHRTAADVDNDRYFRIGRVDASLSRAWVEKVEHDMRYALSHVEPVIVDLALSNICIASYRDETMPLDTTYYLPITDAALTASTILACSDG